MKQHGLKQLTGGLAVAALLLFLAPNGAQARGDRTGDSLGDTEMEHVLVNSGFKVRSASNGGQRSHISRLPDNQFQQVVQNGNTYYLYADKRDNRLYIGDQHAYRAYLGYLHNKKLRQQGVFVWEVRPADRANNKTVEVWHGWTPFPEWSNSRRNDQALPPPSQ
jgi:hypothetical protein